MPSRSILAGLLIVHLAAACPTAASDVEVAIAEARRLVSAGLAQAALDRLEPLVADRGTAKAVAELAAIRFQSRDFAGAAAEYQRLAELVPGDVVVQRNLLIALYRAERFDTARTVIADLGEAMVGANARVLAVRGLLAAQQDQQTRAVEDLQRAAELAPEDTFAIYELGLLHLAQGSPDKAAIALQEAVRRNPNSGSAYYNLGQAMIRSGDTEAGRAAFARAAEISRQSNDEQTRRKRGVALAVRAQEYLAAGDAASALRDLDRAAEVFPDDPQLAMLHEKARAALKDSSR